MILNTIKQEDLGIFTVVDSAEEVLQAVQRGVSVGESSNNRAAFQGDKARIGRASPS